MLLQIDLKLLFFEKFGPSMWKSMQDLEKCDRNYTTSAFLNSSLEKKCPFCNLSNHPASKCLKVTNMAARKQVLRQKRMCFICFNSDHLAKMCKSSYKCRKCRRFSKNRKSKWYWGDRNQKQQPEVFYEKKSS